VQVISTVRERNPYRRLKKRLGLTWDDVAAILGISHGYARKLGCGQHRSVTAFRAKQWEERSQGEIKAHDILRWALEDPKDATA